MKNKFWIVIFAIMLVTLFVWQQTSLASNTWQDDSQIPTTIGESAQGTAVSTTTNPPTIVENGERPLGNNYLYLPIIISIGPEIQEVIDLVNIERTKAGCAPLQANMKLIAAAQGHSQDMALNDFFDHVGSNGSTVGQRISAQGYSYSTWAENIAAGYTTAAGAVSGWMNSSGHRDNILNCNFQETGVGYYYLPYDTGSENWFYYWTQVFASP